MSASGCTAGFHEASRVGPRGALRSLDDRPNRRRPRESPRGRRRQGDGRGFGPGRDPNGGFGGFGLPRLPESGKASAQRFRSGDRRGFGLDASRRTRPGFGPAGSAKGRRLAGLRPRLPRPAGDWRGASGPLSETHRGPNGSVSSRSGIQGSGRGLAPRRAPEAAQREMAAPPSDGSQGWDKWGPVATPAPIIVSGLHCPGRRISRFSCPAQARFCGKARRREAGLAPQFICACFQD